MFFIHGRRMEKWKQCQIVWQCGERMASCEWQCRLGDWHSTTSRAPFAFLSGVNNLLSSSCKYFLGKHHLYILQYNTNLNKTLNTNLKLNQHCFKNNADPSDCFEKKLICVGWNFFIKTI